MKSHELWRKMFGENHPEGEGPWQEGWVHPPSLGTYQGVANWVSPDFFFSKNIGWENTGIVGVVADFALCFLKGDILEIGCGVSSIYLSALSKKYNRKLYLCDIESGKIINPLSVKGYISEDADFFICPSDDMFAKNTLSPLAFAFIDGDHTYEQAKKDFWNVEKLLVDDGYILMHDTYPPSEDYVDFNCCGNVYKFRQEIEKDPRFDVLTLRGRDSYVASTLIRKKSKNRPYYQE